MIKKNVSFRPRPCQHVGLTFSSNTPSETRHSLPLWHVLACCGSAEPAAPATVSQSGHASICILQSPAARPPMRSPLPRPRPPAGPGRARASYPVQWSVRTRICRAGATIVGPLQHRSGRIPMAMALDWIGRMVERAGGANAANANAINRSQQRVCSARSRILALVVTVVMPFELCLLLLFVSTVSLPPMLSLLLLAYRTAATTARTRIIQIPATLTSTAQRARAPSCMHAGALGCRPVPTVGRASACGRPPSVQQHPAVATQHIPTTWSSLTLQFSGKMVQHPTVCGAIAYTRITNQYFNHMPVARVQKDG